MDAFTTQAIERTESHWEDGDGAEPGDIRWLHRRGYLSKRAATDEDCGTRDCEPGDDFFEWTEKGKQALAELKQI